MKSMMALLVLLMCHSISNADVAPTAQKIGFAQKALTSVLNSRGYVLQSDSLNLRTSYHAAQIALQGVNLVEKLIPAGENGSGGQGHSDLDVVRFNAQDIQGRVYKGWIHLFSVTAKGCQNNCIHQLEEPTAEAAVSTSSNEQIYFRLYNFSLPRTIDEMNLHLKIAD